MAESRIDPFDVGALERSVNDSAGRVSGIWLSFVVFSAYLAAAASMITHRQIFLEEPIKLPTINIDLPLFASAVLLPTVFVIYHVFVLLQVVLLARTADAYNEAVEYNLTEEPDRIRLRQRLANTLFAQLFAGSSREREGALGWLLSGMAWVTLAIAPVGVLIIFQIKFLPYHHAAVTWTHRGLIAFDLLAVLLLWASAVRAREGAGWRSLTYYRMMTLAAFAVFVLSNLFITFPGEPGRYWTTIVFKPDPAAGGTAECQIPKAIEAVLSPGLDRLVLLGEDFVDDARFDKIAAIAQTNGQNLYESERTTTFRERDLRCARLAGTDLRLADFRGANLSGAILRAARLRGATFIGANLTSAVLDGAQLHNTTFSLPKSPVSSSKEGQVGPSEMRTASAPERHPADAHHSGEMPLAAAQLQNASLQGAQLFQAFLNEVNLDGADLRAAQLEEASLVKSNLRGAALMDAGLRQAKLDHANLQGASFDRASLAGASLVSAQMQGVSLQGTWMLGTYLDSAAMHGAFFDSTQLEGTTFYRTELQGALFQNALFKGTVFVEAQLQGVQVLQSDYKAGPLHAGALHDSIVSGSFLWNAGSMRCDFTHVTHIASPNFDPIIKAGYSGEKSIAATDQGISHFIEGSLKDVPEKSNAAVNFSKSRLQADLISRLGPPASTVSAPIERAWRNCASESKARSHAGFQKLAANIVSYACGSPNLNQFAMAFATGTTVTAVTTGATKKPRSRWAFELRQIPVGKMFAKSILEMDEAQCPNVTSLTEPAKQLLRYVKNLDD
jgi:uncharacterized protein YjbI with pentapeptide repeats